jgi:hypothetical protein
MTPSERMAAASLAVGVVMGWDALWASEPCRLALSLGLDSSQSVDATEWRLQVEGVAAALRDDWLAEKLVAARMKLHVYEWSHAQWVILPATAIESRADLERAATAVLRHTRRGNAGTGTGAAILFGAQAIAEAGCWEGVLDISGDEDQSLNPGPRAAREAIDPEITINGLVVGAPEHVITWYQENVIQGPFAFVEYAEDFTQFAEAMRRKMAREVAAAVAKTP